MKFRINEDSMVFKSVMDKHEPELWGFKVDEHGCFECSYSEIISALRVNGCEFLTLIEGESFDVSRHGETITMNALENAGIQDLLDEVNKILEEIYIYHLDEVREASKILGYIPATQQGVKQIAKKFQGREQEFLDLLKELYPKK